MSISSNNSLPSWEAVTSDSSQWEIRGWMANCSSGDHNLPIDPESCPFKQIPSVKIMFDQYAHVSSFSAYANNILLLDLKGVREKIMNIYKAWDGCYDTGLCTINFIAEIPRKAGSPNDKVTIDIGNIVVDMDNEMKIVQVNSDPTISVKILKKDNSNAINIETQY